MNIHRFEDAPPGEIAAALARFERQFTYPLGPGRSFHISHGEDYPRFFRAIGGRGRAASFVASGETGEILGTLGVALREVLLPGGETVTSAYLGDLKTVPDARRARVLVGLSARAFVWGREQGAAAAYGVVMDGTPRSPSTYSGRFGIPAFAVTGHVGILRLPVPSFAAGEEEDVAAGDDDMDELHARLSTGRHTPLGGEAAERSERPAFPLVHPQERACGVLEDTRRAKRLLLDDGGEMVSAHLSKFAYADPMSGASLLRQALEHCARGKLAPALFVSVPEVDAATFTGFLKDLPGIVHAPATIYAAGFPADAAPWNLNTAEI